MRFPGRISMTEDLSERPEWLLTTKVDGKTRNPPGAR